MVRLMGLEPIRSPIRPSNVRVCLFRHNRIFHCERYYNAFRCICQHKLCPKVNIFLKLCKFPPFAHVQGAKRAAFMLEYRHSKPLFQGRFTNHIGRLGRFSAFTAQFRPNRKGNRTCKKIKHLKWHSVKSKSNTARVQLC